MQIDKLFSDATGVKPEESGREKQRGVSALLTEAGWPVSPDTVKKWADRDRIPSEWLARIFIAAERRGLMLKFTDYA